LIGEGDFRAQVEQVFKNLKTAVEAAGGNMHDLLKLNYYLVASVNPSEQPTLREVRDRYVNGANPPASTLAVIHRVAQPGGSSNSRRWWRCAAEPPAIRPSRLQHVVFVVLGERRIANGRRGAEA
jgi:enamine deaminase RidA (YjgF/YER057c/UK114 family)